MRDIDEIKLQQIKDIVRGARDLAHKVGGSDEAAERDLEAFDQIAAIVTPRKLSLFDRDGFTPDWSEGWTAEEAEVQLSHNNGNISAFKFRGPGWYIAKDRDGLEDTILVLPESVPQRAECLHTVCPFGAVCRFDWRTELERDPFRATWPKATVFRFHVYNGRNPGKLFGLIARAPTRLDER